MNSNANAAGVVLIVGAGGGLSASLARLFHNQGMRIALAARNADKLAGLRDEVDGSVFACDASERVDVNRLFQRTVDELGAPEVVVYNPSFRTRGPLVDLDPADVERALMVTCYGGFLVGQSAARLMLDQGRGTILLTGASASVKGYVHSAPFAMGKFVHVAHFIIDGGIQRRSGDDSNPDNTLDPDAIARTYLDIHRQHRSAWTWEVELRPWVEKF